MFTFLILRKLSNMFGFVNVDGFVQDTLQRNCFDTFE